MEDRHSKAAEPRLVTDSDEIARVEARNALRQFDAVIQLVEQWTASDHPPFKLRASTILVLHREALDGISAYAGTFRPSSIDIGGSKHKPVDAFLVPAKVEELCEYVNEHWTETALHLSAYTLWRLNWIHPFTDGNGRTARAVAYLILCARIGQRLPGTKTIPEQISSDKQPYYSALEAADGGHLKPLEDLLGMCLARQLYDVHVAATTPGDRRDTDRTLH
jgi:Fic family protein